MSVTKLVPRNGHTPPKVIGGNPICRVCLKPIYPRTEHVTLAATGAHIVREATVQ